MVIILIIFCIFLIYLLKKKESFDIIKNKDIIVVDFKGGIGNQLFFLATAFEYSLKFKKKLIIKNKDNIYSYGGNRNFIKSVYKNFNIQDIDAENFKLLNETNINKYHQDNILLDNNDYYQNYKYFIKSRDIFINKLNLVPNNQKNNLIKKYNLNSSKKNICIHFRHSDKFTPKNWIGIYTDDEINKILNHCYKNYDNQNILFFSNNVSVYKDKLKKFNNINYVHEKDCQELFLMSLCNIYYCSPSTFNWWGIYLNKTPEKVYLLWNVNTVIRKDLYNNYKYLKNKLFLK